MIAIVDQNDPKGRNRLSHNINLPVSQTALELEELKNRLAAMPTSVNLTNLPASIRDPILKAIGERGDEVGLLPRGMFGELRPGSLRFDKMEAKKKADFLRRLIAAIAGYMALYQLVSEKIAFADVQTERILKSLDEGISILEKNRKNSFDPEANPKHIIPMAKKQRKEIIDFRDTELKKFKDRLEAPDLPTERELIDMQNIVDKKMSRFQKFKDAMARKLIDVARYGFEVVADLSAASFAELKKKIKGTKNAKDSSEGGHADFNDKGSRKKPPEPAGKKQRASDEDPERSLNLDEFFRDSSARNNRDNDPVAD